MHNETVVQETALKYALVDPVGIVRVDAVHVEPFHCSTYGAVAVPPTAVQKVVLTQETSKR
jgi:hypothetical protein